MPAVSSGGDPEAWASWTKAYRAAIATNAQQPSPDRWSGPHFQSTDASWRTPDGQLVFVPCQMLWGLDTVAPSTRLCLLATAALCGAALAALLLPSMFQKLRRRAPALDDGVDERAPASAASNGRSFWLDNARFLLIVTIVLGHAISIPTLSMPERSFYLQPVLVLTSFYHMVTFSFISGVTSKPQLTRKRMGRMLTHLIFPYVISKVAWWLFALRGDPNTPLLNLFDTYSSGGLEWYIASLVSWRLLIALLSPVRPCFLMSLAIVLGLVAGYWSDNRSLFALQRTLSFFPFFVAGYLFDAVAAERRLRVASWVQVVARLLLFTILAVGVRHSETLSNFDLGTLGDLNFDYASLRVEGAGWRWQSREPCGLEFHLSWTHRFVRYALHSAASALFLAAVPTGKCFFTEAGSRTMYPYLLHPWVTSLGFTPLMNCFPHFVRYINTPNVWPGGWFWLFWGACAFPQTLLLSSGPVILVFGCIIEPQWLGRLLLKPEDMPEQRNPVVQDMLTTNAGAKGGLLSENAPNYQTLSRSTETQGLGHVSGHGAQV